MSRATDRTGGEVVGEFLSVAQLLEEPRLAQVYAHCHREDTTSVQDLMEALELPQGTAYAYVDRLTEAGVLEVDDEGQPRTYTARPIDLTVTTGTDAGEYHITPALVDAVGRRTTDADIDTYIDRHGIAGLATALEYALDRERGTVTHRLMARDLDISPLAAEIILQALRPVVHEHFDIEPSGASLDNVVAAEEPAIDDEGVDEP
ncbi:winged helix-turn-helix domain-containing protein [Haloglomus halophilum]|uniref:winged helix-turn-helix domain-containing protein n=1 Tax=Haloglomus halophilum TaxID=2962672 RepID=UPI0020C9B0E4|nr:helix-turn-helix domain-containing protein [Haloglomus halophilum]